LGAQQFSVSDEILQRVLVQRQNNRLHKIMSSCGEKFFVKLNEQFIPTHCIRVLATREQRPTRPEKTPDPATISVRISPASGIRIDILEHGADVLLEAGLFESSSARGRLKSITLLIGILA
jgi:hypothetical protein